MEGQRNKIWYEKIINKCIFIFYENNEKRIENGMMDDNMHS